jgi:L-aminopeptidase/D-esterase-like protein
MDRVQRLVGLSVGFHQLCALRLEGLADALDPRGHLGPWGVNADPDLAPRVVQSVVVGPDDGHRERHRSASLSTCRVEAMAETWSLREHGLRIGALHPGQSNSIADVGDVTVGHVTVVRDEPVPPSGRGVARSGVTAIVPRDPARLRPEPVIAGEGGIGTASRIAGDDATVGVLLLANFGSRPDLRVDGVPVGRLIGESSAGSRSTQPGGSCIAVVATDAPLTSAQLCRVARRAGLGLGRTGSVGHHYSGEIFLAFSTSAHRPATEYGGDLDPLFSATVDATEEAVLNALWNAETTKGREGRVVEALPRDEVLELLRAHHRLER